MTPLEYRYLSAARVERRRRGMRVSRYMDHVRARLAYRDFIMAGLLFGVKNLK